MAKKSITDVVATMVDELRPLSSEDRRRAVQASLTLLGEAEVNEEHDRSSGKQEDRNGNLNVPARAKSWVRQYGLSEDQLNQVFLFDGDQVELIAAIPGKNNREKVRNAYVLLGVARLLSAGEPKFADKDARSLCKHQGVYDDTNHMKHMKGGNEFTGSKDKGWILTAPGLKHGASLVQLLGGKD